jgi:hypothetical protein
VCGWEWIEGGTRDEHMHSHRIGNTDRDTDRRHSHLHRVEDMSTCKDRGHRGVLAQG